MADREKVINGLECCMAMSPKHCRECPYYTAPGNYPSCVHNFMMNDILELLKEQEPIEPYKPEEVWRCSACDEIVGWEEITMKNDDVYHKYCPNCGRKVKWDEQQRTD